jgi:hypothetical protein
VTYKVAYQDYVCPLTGGTIRLKLFRPASAIEAHRAAAPQSDAVADESAAPEGGDAR